MKPKKNGRRIAPPSSVGIFLFMFPTLGAYRRELSTPLKEKEKKEI
jgi:hypothetical protein